MTIVGILDRFLGKEENLSFKKNLRNVLGFTPGKLALYKAALTHRSVRDSADENNERLEYLGDAILSGIVADFLFKKYPYKEEGFLTEMRSKMVNRNKLNEIAIKMGLKKITFYNKFDNSLKMSQIFGNTLEAVVGAIYLDRGFSKTKQWVFECIIIPHLYMEDLENLEINHKNKLYGWANKNGKNLEFETLDERIEGGRRLFTIGAVVDGELLAEGKAYNKKDASQIAAAIAIDKLGLNKTAEPEED
ncbi:ribonuclease III [Niastella yeongjuensis]|uniref:Ribonuclease 3 n=1 Tax=Niastella yeongjuensis TaxID=354355 RepID=A0A1V9EM40_9BACT|nr:ribonuclease III [Niastella yeongjuensis]SEN70721.1 ribonuclease-3 [Niastella yeongjuensis]